MERRKPGKKEPDGETKTRILLYIAEHPNAPTDEIWDYMHEKTSRRNMKEKKQLYTHLRELVEKKWLTRNSGGHKTADKFTINNDFESFIGIYDSIANEELKTAYMKTRYYNEHTDLEYFLPRYLVKTWRDVLLKIHEFIIKDVKGHDKKLSRFAKMRIQFLYRVEELGCGLKLAGRPLRGGIWRVGREKLIRRFREIPTRRFINDYLELIIRLKTYTIEDLVGIVKNNIDHRDPAIGRDKAEYYMALIAAPPYLIPHNKWPILQRLIREYPPVMDFLLKVKYYDVIMVNKAAMYLLNLKIFGYHLLERAMIYTPTGDKNRYFCIQCLAVSIEKNDCDEDPPLFQLLRSLAMTYHYKKVIHNSDLIEGIKKLDTKLEKTVIPTYESINLTWLRHLG